MALRGKPGWAALVLLLAPLAGGCGSSSDDGPSQGASTTPAATTTAGPARTSTTPRSAQRRARSPRRSKTTTTPAPAQRSLPTPAKVGKPQTFRGDGDRVIGRVVLRRNAVVRWTVSGGGAFTVRDAGGRLKISGRGTRGQSFAASGDYRSVKVTARGRWTLSFASLGT